MAAYLAIAVASAGADPLRRRGRHTTTTALAVAPADVTSPCQALAELAMRRSVQRNPVDRAHVIATRIAVVASTIAVWDLHLLVLR